MRTRDRQSVTRVDNDFIGFLLDTLKWFKYVKEANCSNKKAKSLVQQQEVNR